MNRSLSDLLPFDHNSTAQDWHYLKELPKFLANPAVSPIELLDLGAGDGRSRAMAQKFLGDGKVRWRGVDIGDSEEHLGRPANAPHIDLYDGVKLPYDDASFDVIWCRQVLEHVRYPDLVLAEVNRALKPGGLFVGSVSQLEPYHSRSIFNWTHYGICVVFGDHGLEVEQLTPGVDGLLLMLRAVFGYQTPLNKLIHVVTPVNQILDALFGMEGKEAESSKRVAHQRIKVAGHIHFLARKVIV